MHIAPLAGAEELAAACLRDFAMFQSPQTDARCFPRLLSELLVVARAHQRAPWPKVRETPDGHALLWARAKPAGAFLLVVVTATIAKIANRAQGESDAHPCACATAPVRTCPSGETALVAFPGRLDRHSIIRQARRFGGKFPRYVLSIQHVVSGQLPCGCSALSVQ